MNQLMNKKTILLAILFAINIIARTICERLIELDVYNVTGIIIIILTAICIDKKPIE